MYFSTIFFAALLPSIKFSRKKRRGGEGRERRAAGRRYKTSDSEPLSESEMNSRTASTKATSRTAFGSTSRKKETKGCRREGVATIEWICECGDES